MFVPMSRLIELAEQIADARNQIHGGGIDGHPWSPSIVDTARRRLGVLRSERNQAILGEIRRGHDPVDVAARARVDTADVARLLATEVRTLMNADTSAHPPA